jgi:putative SOS response-associated peptidase YedK
MAFAGLWESWRPNGPAGPRLITCAIVTTVANATLRPIHDRMPVIVPRDRWDAWLDPHEESPDALRSLLGSAPDDMLERYRVSSAVNHVARNDPSLVEAEPDGSPAAGDPGSPVIPVPLTLL